MKKEMLINVAQPEECRIAILENGVLEELYVERTSHESYVGNIYKGRIVNIEPSIQAAFVDFGVGRNGFLHISDVEPTYYRHLEARREGGDDRGRRGDRGGDRGERPQGRRGDDRGRDRDRGGDRGRERNHRRPPDVEDYPMEAPAEPRQEAAPAAPVPEAWQEPWMAEPAAEAPTAEPLAEQPPAEQPPAEVAPEAAAEPPPPLTALPGTQIEEELAKGRRRSRGGPRRRRAPAGEEAAPEGEAPPSPPMESAERRTTERDDAFGSAGGSESPDGGFDDDLLFFPPPAQPAAPPARQREPEPEPELEPPALEDVAFAPPPQAPPARHGGRPPSRPRPVSRGNIEDDLEADLEAAEISEPAEMARREVVEERAEVREEEPAGRAVEFAEGFEEHFEEDLDEAPPPRHHDDRPRDDRPRGGPRRDDRRDDRRGGPRRDDRRGGPRRGGRPGMGRDKPLIQDVFKRGQEVLVRVIKEGIGTKGPTLSTYLSIPGRYLVIMPHLSRICVSRKIEDDEQRRRLKELFGELKPPRGLGFIMRTAAVDKNKKDLQRDLAYLSRLWQVMVRRIKKLKAPAEIYQESDMITRTIRDTFTNDIDTIWVDDPTAFEHAQEFLQIVMPRYADRIKLYDGKEPLFHRYGIEEEIHKIQQRKVPLPTGGSIVIEQTEALVAIDVNSGNFRADRLDAEETAYQMNLQAAREIGRQLRLRDLGGVIVNDFIDMRGEAHRRGVETALRLALERDRARTKILKTSAFGLIEMTRQRIRPSLKRSVYQDCPHCKGMAQVKTFESMSLEVMRLLQLASHREHVQRIDVRVAPGVADYLLNRKRREIAKLEGDGNIQVNVQGTAGAPAEMLEFVCLDKNNNEVKVLPQEPPPAPRYRR